MSNCAMRSTFAGIGRTGSERDAAGENGGQEPKQEAAHFDPAVALSARSSTRTT
jgi:hypothetical protein